MDIFPTELEIRLSFVNTLEFRGSGLNNPNHPRYATDPFQQQGKRKCAFFTYCFWQKNNKHAYVVFSMAAQFLYVRCTKNEIYDNNNFEDDMKNSSWCSAFSVASTA
jgi:hypothetical protein